MAKKTVDPLSEEGLRAEFWRLKPIVDDLDAQLAPLQAEQAEIANYQREREIEVNLAIKKLNVERGEAMQRMATVSKALSGRTGEAAPVDEEAE